MTRIDPPHFDSVVDFWPRCVVYEKVIRPPSGRPSNTAPSCGVTPVNTSSCSKIVLFESMISHSLRQRIPIWNGADSAFTAGGPTTLIFRQPLMIAKGETTLKLIYHILLHITQQMYLNYLKNL